MKPVRVGVVGVGYLGAFHVQKYAALSGVELIGIADINTGRAQQISAQYQVPAFTDYHDLFGKVDAVSVVVPTSLHHAIARDFLAHGIDVLVEKPITVTIEEADELIALARRERRILQVGHLERFNPALCALKGIVQNPLFIETHRLAPFKDRGTDVDVILDIMIHDIDIILSLVNAPIRTMHAVGVPVVSPGKNDIANVRFEFATGCVANVTASRISVKEMRKLRIFQQDAYLSIDFAAQHADVYRRFDAGDAYDTPQIMYDPVTITPGDALEQEIASFVAAVRGRSEPVVTGEAGRAALKVALDIVAQIETKKAALQLG
ncbi:MAG: Gfo/Idh/MocA family oxidoreductase [Desulfobacterota bacterium]|nr:Gfo/Idh/MocA family oxidoreductase [Thermodesulfobacteriota bacterium]